MDDNIKQKGNKKNLSFNLSFIKHRPDLVRKIYGSHYNALIATDKYYGLFGKTYAAIAVNRAYRKWPLFDSPRLKEMKDIHKDRERCFIICNGPSLNHTDLSKLKNEITIGVNGIYLNFDRMNFIPTYYVVEDELVAEDRKYDINRIKGPLKFFALRLAYCLKRDKDTVFLNHSPDLVSSLHPVIKSWVLYQRNILGMDMLFSDNAAIATFSGNTVTYTCLQLAYHLGLREIYIIGADHNYIVPDRYKSHDMDENFIIDPQEYDVNHFDPGYFGKGYRYHNPKIHMIEKSYQNARIFYEAIGGKIFNATKGGNLEIFERVNYDDLFKPGYVNPVYKAYKEQIGDIDTIPFNYNGPYFSFFGNSQLKQKLEGDYTNGYVIEFILLSETESKVMKYSDIHPAMPILIPPLQIYQPLNNSMRIRLCEDFDINYERFCNYKWYKFRIEANRKEHISRLYVNNVIIYEKSVYIPIGNFVQLGRGIKNRYWKGRIGYVYVGYYNDDGDEIQAMRLSPTL